MRNGLSPRCERLHPSHEPPLRPRFLPGVLKWLIEANAQGRLYSIDRVSDEIASGDDALSEWAADRGEDFFLRPDAAMLPTLQSVSAWATGQHYEPSPVKFVADQVALYEATNGAEGGTLQDKPVVILGTWGRHTGKVCKSPLMRVEHNGTSAVIALMGGAPKHPVRYLNIEG